MVRTALKGRVVNEIEMGLPNLPVADATLEQLQVRLVSTFRAENQAAAVRAETLAELTRREGAHLIEDTPAGDGSATPPQSPLRGGNRPRTPRATQNIRGDAPGEHPL